MIPSHLKPSMVFTPSRPPKRVLARLAEATLREREEEEAGKCMAAPEPADGPAPLFATPSSSVSVAPFSPADGPDADFDAGEEPAVRELPTELPKCVTSRSKQSLPECFALAERRPKRRSPTPREREVMLEMLLRQELPGEAAPGGEALGRKGRPPKIVGQRRQFMLHALRLGLTRREVARRLDVSPATITKLLQRDRGLAGEAAAAQREGQDFTRIFESLFWPGRVVLERKPQLGTLYFEREKEYLIAKGLPARWVRRLRVRNLEEWREEMMMAEASEKALRRVEKEAAKRPPPGPKSRRVVKIVRREFSKKDGRPMEEIRYTVEQRGAGRPATRPWAELEGLPKL